ncbi:MAG: hypothetical protein HXY40_02955 [Chloroflexi bacterium]|nr:hypothetical protein [Chloroflexota bacterium]
MNTYRYLIRPPRVAFNETATPEESALVGQHFARLKVMLEAGERVLAGPCTDAAFGVVIFYAPSQEAAQTIMETDPTVKHGVFSAQLHAFRVSLHRMTA